MSELDLNAIKAHDYRPDRNGAAAYRQSDLAAVDVPALVAAVEKLAAEVEQLRADIESRVHCAFGDADEQGLVLDALTVNELTQLVMTAIRAGGEQT